MAGYRGHLTGGAAAVLGGGVLVSTIPWVLVWLPGGRWVQIPPTTWDGIAYLCGLMAIGLMFALWPDVDTDSKGQRLFGGLLVLGNLVLIAGEHFRIAAVMGTLAILPMVGRHRGWTHSWIAMLLVPSPIIAIPYLYMPEAKYLGVPLYVSAVLGYGSHIVIDKAS